MSSAPRFELLQVLGMGGMAEVSLARMELAGRQELVALKRVRADLRRDEDLARQFEHEMRLSAVLLHPNIVALRASGTDAQGAFLAFEYLEGGTAAALLKRLRERKDTLGLGAASAIARDVARALAYSHGFEDPAEQLRGLLHRDISPDNILLSSEGVAKLGDFGIAKLLGQTRVTVTGSVKGKMGYLAPELFEGHDAEKPADVFSFGATLYRLYAGVPPFRGQTDAELMRAVLGATPPPLAQLRAGIPPRVSNWVERALAKNPAQRPERFDEFLEALDAWPAAAEPAGRAELKRLVQLALAEGEAAAEVSASVPPQTPGPGRRPKVRWGRLRTLGIAAGLTALVALATWRGRMTRVPTVQQDELARTPVSGTAAVTVAPPAPERARTPAKPVPVPALGPGGGLRVLVRPWAQVFVDGEFKGSTPLPPLPLRVGDHSVIVSNPKLAERRVYRVHITADHETVLRVALKGG